MGNKNSRNPTKHTKFQLQKIKQLVLELYLPGEITQAEVAKKVVERLAEEGITVEISRQTVGRILQEASQEWVEANRDNIEAIKFGQLGKLNDLYREYADCYAKSDSQQVQVIRVTAEGRRGKQVIATTTKTSNRLKDANILSGMRQVIEAQNKLLGLNSENVQLGGTVKIENNPFNGMSDEELWSWIQANENKNSST